MTISLKNILQLDIKILNTLIRFFKYYINKRYLHQKKIEDRKWLRKFNGKEFFIHKLTNNISIYLYNDSLLSRAIYESFEQEEVLFIKRFLTSGDIFFDVGANIGFYTLHACDIIGETGQIHAFEPSSKTFKRLTENVSLNHLQDKVIVNNIGLSDKTDEIEINLYANGYDAWNSFANILDKGASEKEIVKVETLNNYVKNNNIEVSKISLIKIDVEGWEIPVIKGATDILKSSNAPVLIVEFTEENAFKAGFNCYELYDLIIGLGYKWFKYNSIGNQLIPQQKKIHYIYENLIAIKNLEIVEKRIQRSLDN